METPLKKYVVVMPLAGSLTVELEAKDERHAVEVFWGKLETGDLEALGDLTWEYHEHITTGNVCHASTNDVTVDEV